MKLQRFFIHQYLAEPIGQKGEIRVSHEALSHQLKDVLRLHAGDILILLDNSGDEYRAEIVSLQRNEVFFRVIETHASVVQPRSHVTLYQSVPKKDKFEWILEKVTEIGVSKIVPVLSERSEKKNLNSERCQKILIESSEQSGRAVVPILAEISTLDDVLKSRDPIDESNFKNTQRIVFHPTGESISLFRDSLGKDIRAEFFIGPEGGWSESEIQKFKMAGVKVVSLGSGILRTETAAVVAAALILLA